MEHQAEIALKAEFKCYLNSGFNLAKPRLAGSKFLGLHHHGLPDPAHVQSACWHAASSLPMPCTAHTGSSLSLRNAWQTSRSHHFLTAKCWQSGCHYQSILSLMFHSALLWEREDDYPFPLGFIRNQVNWHIWGAASPSRGGQRSILQVTPGSNSEVVFCSCCWLQKQYSTMLSQACERGFGILGALHYPWVPPPLHRAGAALLSSNVKQAGT